MDGSMTELTLIERKKRKGLKIHVLRNENLSALFFFDMKRMAKPETKSKSTGAPIVNRYLLLFKATGLFIRSLISRMTLITCRRCIRVPYGPKACFFENFFRILQTPDSTEIDIVIFSGSFQT
jgi:hypothetical protein